MSREVGDKDQKPGTAAGKDLQRSYLSREHDVAADHVPQAPGLLGIQTIQAFDLEQLEERLIHVVQSFKTTGGGGQQHDSRF